MSESNAHTLKSPLSMQSACTRHIDLSAFLELLDYRDTNFFSCLHANLHLMANHAEIRADSAKVGS